MGRMSDIAILREEGRSVVDIARIMKVETWAIAALLQEELCKVRRSAKRGQV